MLNKKIILSLYAWLLVLVPMFARASVAQVRQDNEFTQIKIFTPWGQPPQAALNQAITITQEKIGNCWGGSIANPRADAWRCSIGNAIYDPCFSSLPIGNVGDKLLCVKSPWDRKGTIINLDKPLPDKLANKRDYLAHNPWAIEFTDGRRCVYDRTGTLPMLAGLVSSATCFDENMQLMNALAFNAYNKQMPLWRGFVQTTDGLAIEQVPIKVAWY